MISDVDAQLIDEVRRFELRFSCESCAHFDPERALCANGYPNEQHRTLDLTTARTIVFCKEYELS